LYHSVKNSINKKNSFIPSEDKGIYYRLIALWALCEAMLGSIIHGFQIPVSGLFIGSSAVVCICLIAWYVPQKGAIIKATIIVAIFKMMLSPQAPPPAYIAVFFQGVLGELIFFRHRRFYQLSCMVLAVMALLESGLQRILVLTIVLGNDFWQVINNFINGFTKQKTNTNYSLLIGIGYVLIHLFTGLIIGWWASLLPKRILKWQQEKKYTVVIPAETTVDAQLKNKRKKRWKTALLVIWLLLIGLYVQSYFKIGTPLLPAHISLKILLRSFIIVLGWIFIVGPLLTQLLHKWLKKKQSTSQQEVQEVFRLLPASQQLIIQSWKQSSVNKGWKRMNTWSKMILVNALNPITTKGVYILSAPIHSGKTTSLVKWSDQRTDVFGILTPDVNGKRVFMNAHNRQLFLMEAKEGEPETLTVGRFTFSKTNFDKASQIIRKNIEKKGWLVIDEIGPLELRGEGFSEILKEVLEKRKHNILLVVRDKDDMLEKVKTFFSIAETIELHSADALKKLPV
jgi:nucleoside-triphosphatase THEP1